MRDNYDDVPPRDRREAIEARLGHRILWNTERDRNAWYWDVYRMLGLNPKAHLPKEGLPERLVQGIRVYVKPAREAEFNRTVPGFRPSRKAAKHRVMAICACGTHVSAGRLHQHKCKKEGQ